MTAHHRAGVTGVAGLAALWMAERACLRRATRIHVMSDFSASLLWRLYRIPGECTVQVDGRPTPPWDNGRMLAALREATAGSEVVVKSERFKPVVIPSDADIVRVARAASPTGKVRGFLAGRQWRVRPAFLDHYIEQQQYLAQLKRGEPTVTPSIKSREGWDLFR